MFSYEKLDPFLKFLDIQCNTCQNNISCYLDLEGIKINMLSLKSSKVIMKLIRTLNNQRACAANKSQESTSSTQLTSKELEAKDLEGIFLLLLSSLSSGFSSWNSINSFIIIEQYKKSSLASAF